MENDDRPVGRVLTRREFLALSAAAGASFLAACSGLRLDSTATPGTLASATYVPTNAPTGVTGMPVTGAAPACVVRPEMTEGPYFLDEQLNRADIRLEPSDNSVKEGLPLALLFSVLQVGSDSCTPLPGAVVDVWHCDAQGMYSGVTDRAVGFDTSGTKFLRGYQETDAQGAAQFMTIYPGWYPGRAVHIHFKIRTEAGGPGAYEFTSQLFFDENLTDQVHAQEPYAIKGQRDTLNSMDRIFQNGGDQLLLAPTASGDGYQAAFVIGLDLANTAAGRADG